MANEDKSLELQVEASAKKADSELDGIVSTLRDLLSSVTGIKGVLDKTNSSLSKTNSLIKDISGTMFEVVNAAKKNDAGSNMAKGFTKAKSSANDAVKSITSAVTVADKLGEKLGKKLATGGILSESDLYDIRLVNEELAEAALRYERLGSAGDGMQPPAFHGLDIEDLQAWSDANREAKEAAEDAARAEKEFEDLNTQLQKALHNYQNLLRRRKAKISDGNGWSANDIDRAREMSGRILDLASKMDGYGKAGRKAASIARSFIAAQPKDAGGSGTWGWMASAASRLPGIGKGFDFVRKNAKKALDVLTKYGTKITMLDKLRATVNKLGKSFGMTLKFYLSFGLISDVMSSFGQVSKYAAKDNDILNQSLTKITQGYANLKAAATSALLPIVQWLAPGVTNAMNAVAESIHRVGMAFTALSGEDTYQKMTAKALDFASTLKDANNEAKGALASFDKLNILGSDNNSKASQEWEYDTEYIKLDDSEFYRKLKSLGVEAKGTAGGIVTVFTSAFDTIGQYITGNEDFSFMDTATESLRKFSRFLENHGPILGEILGTLGTIAWEAGAILADAFIDVIGFFAGFDEDDTTQEKLEKVRDLLSWIADGLRENRDLFSDIVKVIAGASLAGKIANSGVFQLGKSLVGDTVGLAKGLWGKVSSAFVGSKMGLYLQEANAAGGLGDKLILPFLSKMKTAMGTAGTAVKGFASTASSQIASGFSTAATSVGAFMTQSVASAGALTTGITGITAAVAGLAAGYGLFYKAQGKNIDDVRTDFNAVFHATKEDWTELWNWWCRKSNEAVTDFIELLTNPFGHILEELSSLTNVKRGAKKFASTGRNGYSIYNYASGGIINRGQLFRANERGPELVGSLDGKTAVANQAQVYNAMYDGIYRAVLRAMNMSGGNGGGDINLNVDLDGEKIYSTVVKKNKSRYKQTGRNPLLAY